MPKGIDISEFQGDINLNNYDIDFVIIRAGDGSYWDDHLDINIQKAINAGLPYGLYWLLRDYKIAEAEKTAARLCEYADSQAVRPTVGIWVDLEDEWDDDPLVCVKPAQAFLATVEVHKYYAGYYCNWHYWDQIHDHLSKYDCWIADWDEDMDDDPNVGTMKQYAVWGNVDRDVCFVPLETYNLQSNDPQNGNKIALLRSKLQEVCKIIKEMEDLIT